MCLRRGENRDIPLETDTASGRGTQSSREVAPEKEESCCAALLCKCVLSVDGVAKQLTSGLLCRSFPSRMALYSSISRCASATACRIRAFRSVQIRQIRRETMGYRSGILETNASRFLPRADEPSRDPLMIFAASSSASLRMASSLAPRRAAIYEVFSTILLFF